jgi:glyoxylase-like metal-dependent hydrolase (beta-lactamase superfamily II)
MSDDIPFDRSFDAAAGEMRQVSPLVRRIVAPNPGPFTFTGTCTYVVGRGRVAVIDPGPQSAEHLAALRDALAGETVTHIVVTHTHRDHSPGARALAAATGAPIVGCGPHRSSRPAPKDGPAPLDSSGDAEHRPDQELADGDELAGDGWTLTAVATPGHTANHLAFALAEENALFSGDHVMAWSTTVVAPPDGAMGPYMASLAKLGQRGEQIYWPGHGGPVVNPDRFVRALVTHRRQREASILDRVTAGEGDVRAIVARLYEGLNPALHGGAAMSVLAHLEDMAERGIVRPEGGTGLAAVWRPA